MGVPSQPLEGALMNSVHTPSKTPGFPVHQSGNSAHHFLKSPKGHVSSLWGQFYYLGAFGGSHLTVCIWTFMASTRFLHSQGHPRSQNGGLYVEVFIFCQRLTIFDQVNTLFLENKPKQNNSFLYVYLYMCVCVSSSPLHTL